MYTGIGEQLSQMGQSIGGALARTRTKPEQSRHEAAMLALSEERGWLENELLRSQIAAMKQQSVPGLPTADPMLLGGQRDMPTNKVVDLPMQRTVSGVLPWSEPGAVTDVTHVRTPGGWAVLPSADATTRMEDLLTAQAQWMVRNHILPGFSPGRKAALSPRVPLPEGYNWLYNPMTGEFSRYERPGHFVKRHVS